MVAERGCSGLQHGFCVSICVCICASLYICVCVCVCICVPGCIFLCACKGLWETQFLTLLENLPTHMETLAHQSWFYTYHIICSHWTICRLCVCVWERCTEKNIVCKCARKAIIRALPLLLVCCSHTNYWSARDAQHSFRSAVKIPMVLK